MKITVKCEMSWKDVLERCWSYDRNYLDKHLETREEKNRALECIATLFEPGEDIDSITDYINDNAEQIIKYAKGE